MEKEAERVRDSVMLTVVVEALGSVTPLPVHPVNEYPVFGVAVMVGVDPWSNVPDPETIPPRDCGKVRS